MFALNRDTPYVCVLLDIELRMRNIPCVIHAIPGGGIGDREPMDDVKHVLERAKELLESGWHQGSYTDHSGRFCVRAAIGIASGAFETCSQGYIRFPVENQANDPFRKFANSVATDITACAVVERFLPEPWESIPAYNDAASTTLADVLAIMDKAIASC